MSYRLILLENPLSTWQQKNTRHLLNEVVALKAEGYGRAFQDPFLVIPLDVFDFVGTHLLLFHDDKLAMAYKTVLNLNCQRMNLDFPLHSIVKRCGEQIHQETYFNFFNQYKNLRIAYDCHLTVSNFVANSPEALYDCLSILYALVYYYRFDFQIDYTFMLGTHLAGTHKTFLKMGSKNFADLGPIKLNTYDNRDAQIMICDKNFSIKAKEYALKWKFIWENKKIINAAEFRLLKTA
jgi:hypothetical protein